MSRPSDYLDTGFEAQQQPVNGPRLGPFEWLRWAWRQLTSMRTALLLLLALAIAAVPGSLIPQESSDPNGVIQWKQSNPQLTGLVEGLQGFTVYSSVWFSAIYLLLFVSLVGCVLPRITHHLQALRAAPPRTPARLGRLPAYRSATTDAPVARAVDTAERLLRAHRYRVVRYGDSVSAERGYLRETGNLVFHLGLVGILIAVFIGGGYGYTGQRVVVVGDAFVNAPAYFDTLSVGRFFSTDELQPYSLKLTKLAVKYDEQIGPSFGQPLDYTATVKATYPDGTTRDRIIKVNSPLEIGGASVYLLGNGYAPHVTVRDAAGTTVFSDSVPFLPQDAKLTSTGVIKVLDTKPTQLGLLGLFYPTVAQFTNGADTSIYPDLKDPLLTFNVYAGDLKATTASNAFSLDTDGLTTLASRNKGAKPLQLKLGQTVPLPDGRGTIRFDSVARYASLDIHHDPAQSAMLVLVMLVVAGLLTSLLVPRRRMWLAARSDGDGEVRLEYAALARGDDPGLERALAELAEEHAKALAEEREPRPRERVPADA
jgi:cytochrome c biogenesis protein